MSVDPQDEKRERIKGDRCCAPWAPLGLHCFDGGTVCVFCNGERAASLSPRAETLFRLTNPAKRGPYGTYYFVCCEPFLAVRNGSACPSCGKFGAEEPGALVKELRRITKHWRWSVNTFPKGHHGAATLRQCADEVDALASLHEQIDTTSPWEPLSALPEMNLTESPREVLVWGRSIGVRTGRVAHYSDGYLFAGLANMNGNLADGTVTHWQPLPYPPQGSGGKTVD